MLPHLPSVAQTAERQAPEVTQVSPAGKPHLPSIAQTAERQVAAMVHASSLGVPHLPSIAQTAERQVAAMVHVSPLGLPHLPSMAHRFERQVAWLLQASPLGLPHLPSIAHTADRHAIGMAAMQTPPLGRPQRLSVVSQVALSQTREPLPGEQLPEMGALAGSGWPLGILGTQVPIPAMPEGLSHQRAPQSPSVVQPVPQAPLAPLQMGPACTPMVQLALFWQRPHEPSATQKGAAVSGQARIVIAPLSPVQPRHCDRAASHTGVVPRHWSEL
jgi:hypothetical protein